MGMAEEVSAQKAGNAPAPAVTAEPVAQELTEVMNQGLPAEPAVPEPAPAEPAKAEAKPAEIKIGERTFASAEEALGYAQELETARIQDTSFKEGFKAAQPKTESVDPVTQFAKTIEDKLFEDPAEAVKEIVSFAKQATTTELTAQQAAETHRKQVWDSFYTQNKDLANSQDLVEFVAHKVLEERGEIGLDKGLPLIADKARQMIKQYQEAAKPTQELTSKLPETLGVSGDPTPAPQVQEEKNVDFVTEVNRMKRRRSNVKAM